MNCSAYGLDYFNSGASEIRRGDKGVKILASGFTSSNGLAVKGDESFSLYFQETGNEANELLVKHLKLKREVKDLETQVAEFKKKSESKNNANQDQTLPYFDPQDLSFLDEIIL